MKKRICFFGSYNKTHRNNSLMKGLRENGHEVIECYDDSKKPLKYWKLFKKHQKLKKSYDVLFVGFPNHGLVLFAKILTRKRVVFDPFISLYNTIVEDRKQKTWFSLKSLFAFLLDFLSVHVADVVLIDTKAHGDYFSSTFKARRSKFVVVPVGADDSFFYPRKKVGIQDGGEFKVKFYGTYSPLQGVQYIVESARYLLPHKDIKLYLLGHGQTLHEMTTLAERRGLSNVIFQTERIPVSELPEYMSDADVCLGIFGGTVKSNMVIPHKVYDALAMAKPVITGESSATREFFTNGENIIVCKEADPQDLAEKILLLKDNVELRSRVARGGYDLLLQRFTPQRVVKNLLPILENS